MAYTTVVESNDAHALEHGSDVDVEYHARVTMCISGAAALLDVALSRVTQSGDPSPGMRIPGSHRGIRACIPDEVSEH